MMQDRLFFEDWREAMRHVVAAMGGPKMVGARMRPDMKPDHAGRWVSDCLNADRRENFNPDHLFLLLRLAREAGIHAGMGFIAEEVGYRAEPVNPVDERDALMREFVRAGKGMESLVKRIEDMDARSSRMAAVK